MDFLAYRYPSEPIEMFRGNLLKLDSFEMNIEEQFVISDFNQNDKYLFKIFEKTSVFTANHFLKESPFVISKEEYLLDGARFLEYIKSHNLGKAIYSRIKPESYNHNHIESLFKSLCETYSNAFVYCVSSPIIGTWIGASPEILVDIHNNEIYTMSLAGTKSNISEDTPWSPKESMEQTMVTNFIINTLKDNYAENILMKGPNVIKAGPVSHLITDIKATITPAFQLRLITDLHPTPAVSGLPRNEALQLIAKVEKHKRDLYTGIIGLISTERTKLYVNLRCAQIQENVAFLYLGGGFTKGSNVESEWKETENKSQTLIQVMRENN